MRTSLPLRNVGETKDRSQVGNFCEYAPAQPGESRRRDNGVANRQDVPIFAFPCEAFLCPENALKWNTRVSRYFVCTRSILQAHLRNHSFLLGLDREDSIFDGTLRHDLKDSDTAASGLFVELVSHCSGCSAVSKRLELTPWSDQCGSRGRSPVLRWQVATTCPMSQVSAAKHTRRDCVPINIRIHHKDLARDRQVETEGSCLLTVWQAVSASNSQLSRADAFSSLT